MSAFEESFLAKNWHMLVFVTTTIFFAGGFYMDAEVLKRRTEANETRNRLLEERIDNHRDSIAHPRTIVELENIKKNLEDIKQDLKELRRELKRP